MTSAFCERDDCIKRKKYLQDRVARCQMRVLRLIDALEAAEPFIFNSRFETNAPAMAKHGGDNASMLVACILAEARGWYPKGSPMTPSDRLAELHAQGYGLAKDHLTLRDHFAGLALSLFIVHEHHVTLREVAKASYKVADEMMLARNGE